MTATKFEGKLFTDEEVVFPSIKDYYHNSLEPIVKSYLLNGQKHKYYEDPIGGEDAVGFVTENRGVFAIKCTKDAFDLSNDALFSAETAADSFLFYPSLDKVDEKTKKKIVDIGESAEAQQYIKQLCKNEDIFSGDNLDKYGSLEAKEKLEKLKEYKKRLRLSMMCVSVPKLPRCSLELLPDSEIEKKNYGDLNKYTSNYTFLTYRPEFESGGMSIPYATTDTLYFYKNKQVWKKEKSQSKIKGYSYYYVLASKSGVNVNTYLTSLKIRNDVLAYIKDAKDIRINIPSNITAANANRYPGYDVDNFEKSSFICGIISSILLPNKELIADYFEENTYMHAGFNCAGQDKFNKTIAVIYVKVSEDGKLRWINLNKYILVKYYGTVKNLTSNTTDYTGTDLYVKLDLPEFKPDTYNIGVSCYQDEISRQALIDIAQSEERIKVQKKAFAAAGYSLCQDYDDLYNWTVSIGDVSFFVPPTQIRVTNTTNTDRLPILRARGTMTKSIEKVDTEISLDLYFNNESGINGQPVEMDLWTKKFKDEGELYSTSSEAFKNDKEKVAEGDNGLRTYYMNGLRALISEFRFCPFLPVINKYINETLKISAVSLEQIHVKTVPGFPKLLKAVVVLKEFDYQVYMPEVPEAYFDENDKIVNPFDQCINYDVLRYYYQRPILFGNELAKKLEKGTNIITRKITENGEEKTTELKEDYTFNSLAFIRDTIFGNNKENVRTAFLPCKFEDPTISIYTADENYLQQMLELRRTLYQKRMSMGFAVDSFNPNQNQKKIIAESSSLYTIINPIYEKYALEKIELNRIFQNAIQEKLPKPDYTSDDTAWNNYINSQRQQYVDIEDFTVKLSDDKTYSYGRAVIEKIAFPLMDELKKATENLFNSDNEKLVTTVYFLTNNQKPITDKEELLSYLEGFKYAGINVSINVGLNLKVSSLDIDEIAKQAYVGEDKDEYKDLKNQKNNLFAANNCAAKIFLPDITNAQLSYCSYSLDFDSWNKPETDIKFLEFCNYHEDSLIYANEEQQELKQAIDYEDAKTIKFNKVLEKALVSDFEASLNNNFARISLLESGGFANQYMGGSDIHISWHIRTKDETLVNTLQALPAYEAHCMRTYHNVLPCFPIRIESEFTKLLGVFEVSIEDVIVETVPNYPGLYDVSIRAISTDRTLRNRESLRAINDDKKYDENPELENAGETDDDYIDNSGIKRGKIRTRINIRTQKQLYEKMAKAELYPDLELPRVDDLVKLGFRFIRYKDKEREINSGFVDPDFYVYYSHIIFSELLKKHIDLKFRRSLQEDEEKESVKEFTGTVEEIEDGDTIKVRVSNDSSLRYIRFALIDTPEINHKKTISQLEQAGGQEAKKFLSNMIYQKNVTVKYKELDHYGRYLGRVYLGSTDINKEMVRQGWAWHDSAYDKSDEYDEVAALQKNAIEKRLGIFNPKLYAKFNPTLYAKMQSLIADLYKESIYTDEYDTEASLTEKKQKIDAQIKNRTEIFDTKFDEVLNRFLDNPNANTNNKYIRALKELQDEAAKQKQVIPYPIEPWKTRPLAKIYIYDDNTIIANGKPSMHLADLNGCKVQIDWKGNIDMSTANNKFREVVEETQNKIASEQKALHRISNQALLSKMLPAMSIGDKGLWTVSNQILCSFKESYIVNLEKMFEEGNRVSSDYNEKQYANLHSYYSETFKKINDAANEIICGTNSGLKTIDISATPSSILIFDPENWDKRINNIAYEFLKIGSAYRQSYDSLLSTTLTAVDYASDPYGFYTNSNDYNPADAISVFLKSIKAVNTASQEYNYEVKNEAWKGCQYFDSKIRAPYYGELFNGEKGTKEDHEKNGSNFRLNGPFHIRSYSFNEIIPYLSEIETDEILALSNYNEKRYVLDPYYRLKSNDEILAYLKKCRENIDFATEAEFRVILWWLARLYQENIFPSLSFDIERDRAKMDEKSATRAKNLIEDYLKEANEKQSIAINTNLVERIGKFVEKNENALDNGKFFVAALFALRDEPFTKSEIFNRIVTRNYDWLNNYIIKLTNRSTPERGGITDSPDTKTRRFLLALCGYKFIDDPTYIGKSSEITPAEQFSSIYNTKLALEACEDPNMYLFHSFYDMIRGDYRGRLLRAFPTYYCLFIDEGKEIGLWKIFDNFYSMTGINEISITKSRKIATETCSITLSNNYNTFTFDDEDCYINYVGDFWGELFDMFFDQKSLALKMDMKRRHATKYVNRAKLSPGIRIHVRMGYGSDARELSGLFNGVIAEVNPNARTVDVVAQGNGVELMNPIILKEDADEVTQIDDTGFFRAPSSGGTPRNILAGILTSKANSKARYIQGQYDPSQMFYKEGEKHWDTDFMWGLGNYLNYQHQNNILGIRHYGEVDDRSVFPSGEICQNLYEIMDYPALDDGELSIYREEKDDKHAPYISFNIHNRTFWDIMHICKSVGPDFICSTAPFGFRDTIFLGRPRYYYAYDYVETGSGAKVERRKPFQQHYMLYSNSDIISNDITASSKVMKTAAIGVYNVDKGITDDTKRIGPIFVDQDIYPEEQKTFVFDTRLSLKPQPRWYNTRTTTQLNTFEGNKNYAIEAAGNTIGKAARNTWQFFMNIPDQIMSYMDNANEKTAWSATANALKDSVKEMYQGGVVIIAMPSIKPFDRLYINDAYNDMSGQVEVRDVVHTMSMEAGFISSINVDAISVVDDRKEFYAQSFGSEFATETFGFAVSAGVYKMSSNMTKKFGKEVYSGMRKMEKLAKDVRIKIGPLFKAAKTASAKNPSIFKSKGILKGLSMAKNYASKGWKAVKGGMALLTLNPPGWVAFIGWLVAETAVHAVAHSIENAILFKIKNSQALIIFPLKRYGMPYTAGLSGSMGLVYGSPTFNDMGPIEELYSKWLLPNEENSDLADFLRVTFLSEDIMNEAAKYRRDNTAFNPNAGNTIGNEIQMQSSIYGVARNRGSGKFSSIYGMSAQNRINPFDEGLNENEKQLIKERFNDAMNQYAPKNIEDFTTPKIYNQFRNVAEDIRFRKFIGTQNSPNGFLRILHKEKQNSRNSKVSGISGNYHKDVNNISSMNVPYIRYEYGNNKSYYDVPFLSVEAFNVLREIVNTAYNSVVKIQRTDVAQLKADCGNNHIILYSALQIGNEGDKTSAAGYSFTIKAIGNELKLNDILKKLYDDKGKKVFYSETKGNNQYKITVYPIDYIIKTTGDKK